MKKGYDFEKEQGGVYERIWRKERGNNNLKNY